MLHRASVPSIQPVRAPHARSDVGHRGTGEIPLAVRARTAAPAPQRSPRLPSHAPRPGCLRLPTASDDPSKHASHWLPPRHPGDATTQTEKSTPVHTSNSSSAGGRSSPCGVPSADERRLSLPHRATGLSRSKAECSTSTGSNNGPVLQHHGRCQPSKRGDVPFSR